MPEGPLSFRSVQDMFQKFAEKIYTPFHAQLQCGNFKCPVQLHPRPEPYSRYVDHTSGELIRFCSNTIIMFFNYVILNFSRKKG